MVTGNGRSDALHAALVAHGLIAPMATIRGSADLMLAASRQLTDDDRRRLCGQIRDAAQFVAEVLGELAEDLPPDAVEVLRELDSARRA